MGNLHMIRQGLQSNKETPPDIDLEYKIKTNIVVFTTVDPSIIKEGNIYSDLCEPFPTVSNRGGNVYMSYMCMTVTPS